MDGYTREHVPAATDTKSIIEDCVFYVVSAEILKLRDEVGVQSVLYGSL
jgi:hypothetical protein